MVPKRSGTTELNVRAKTIKVLKENEVINLHDPRLSKKSTRNKEETDKLDMTKM